MDNESIHVVVGSTNPTKIAPVEQVFSHLYASVEVYGLSVPSGVSDQPMSEDEMYTGAYNRAKNAIGKDPSAVFGVGIEGGLKRCSYGWFEQSFVVIIDKNGKTGVGASGGLVLPMKVMRLIKNGKNLEEAVDMLCHTDTIGEGIGMFGVFTNSLVTRAEGVRHGVAFALARFLHPELYE